MSRETNLHRLGDATSILRRGARNAGAPSTVVPAISSAIFSQYARLAAECGVNAPTMLRRVGLDPMILIDPRVPVPVTQAIELIELSALECGRDDFGLQLALHRGVPDIGPISLLLREEPTLRAALRSLQTYFPVHSRSLAVLLTEHSDHAILSSNFALAAHPYAASQSTEMVICSLLSMLRWLIGIEWTPSLVSFSHRPPKGPHLHARALRCPVAFKQSVDGVFLTIADLDRPLSSANPVMRRHAEEYLSRLVDSTPDDFTEVAHRLILAMLPTGRCSSVEIARQLGIDRTTLNRRLASGGQTYSTVLQMTRVSMIGRVCSPGRSLAEVADILGFQSLSSFSRWFSDTFGMSPRVWRASGATGLGQIEGAGDPSTRAHARSPDRSQVGHI